MKTFDRSDPIWKLLNAIEAEPSGEFHKLVAAAGLDPKVDFRYAHLVNLPLRDADVSGFDFSGSDLRGSGLRFAAHFDDLEHVPAGLNRRDSQGRVSGRI